MGDYITPEMYGANTIPGTTDMTAAIQAAANSLTMGGTILFEPKAYKVTNKITIPYSNTTFIGIRGRSKIIQATANKNIFYASAKDNISFRDLFLYGEGTYSSGWTGTSGHDDRGIQLDDCTRVTIEDCLFQNHGQAAIMVDGGRRIAIRNNIVEGTHEYSTAIASGNNYQYGIGVRSLAADQAQDIIISGNNVSGVTQGIVVSNLSGTAFPRGVNITGNNVHDIPGQHGLYLSATDLTVTGNTIKHTEYDGIKITASGYSCSTVVVSGNTVDESPNASGIEIVGYDTDVLLTGVAVTGNVVNNAGYGITVAGQVSRARISGNIIMAAGGYGIYVANNALISEVDIAGNTVSDAYWQGIAVFDGDNIRIVDNRIIDPNQAADTHDSGVYICGGTNIDIFRNRITDADANMTHGLDITGGSGLKVRGNAILGNIGASIMSTVALDDYIENEVPDSSSVDGLKFNTSQDVEWKLTSSSGANQIMWYLNLDDESAYVVKVRLVAMKSGSAERGMFEASILVYRDGGGNATIEGTAMELVHVHSAGFAGGYAFGIIGIYVKLDVTSGEAANYNWIGRFNVIKVL
jgi:hypothetical protein